MATAFGALSSSLELDHNFSKYDINSLHKTSSDQRHKDVDYNLKD
jgi:hypothetical protein